MPYQVQQIIEGKGTPICIAKDEPITKALALMIEHDYSQLPVIKIEQDFTIPDGMITYEGIIRGMRNFKARVEDLIVRDVMVGAPVYSVEDDLFDILDKMKETNAVLVIDSFGPDLVGIVTSFDTSEYFRKRTEDLMRVEDIELMIKEFIKTAHSNYLGEVNETKINTIISQVTAYRRANGQAEKELFFEDLTLAEYISLLLHKDTWPTIEPIFGVQRSFVNELLNGIREIRNALAHFRGDITPEQRDRLKFGSEWLASRQEEFQIIKEKERFEKNKLDYIEKPDPNLSQKHSTEKLPTESIVGNVIEAISSTTFSVTDATPGGGRYAALADWLQSQPGRVDQIALTFNQIEDIIGADLPASARSHRAWWANDSVGHTQSQLWLDAGWRTTYINFGEGKITFSRIHEREKAYIGFFSKLLDDLRKKANFSFREASPDGASWMVIQTVPRNGTTLGMFTFSFSRDKRLRVELYLDLGEQTSTKSAFDKLYAQRELLESQVGEIKWERLDNRRASRLALYHNGHIMEEKGHVELRKWAVETMIKFYNAAADLAEKAINEAVIW